MTTITTITGIHVIASYQIMLIQKLSFPIAITQSSNSSPTYPSFNKKKKKKKKKQTKHNFYNLHNTKG